MLRWLLFLTAVLAAATLSRAEPPRFARDIQPLLSAACYKCHGPDARARKANLRLDTADGLRRVFVAGDPRRSLAYRRLTEKDPARRMPPPGALHTLTPAQIAAIRQWTEAGARWEGHWSFQPIRRPAVPRVPGVRSPIDAFVRVRLAREGVRPAPEADRRTLVRRVTLDLTGLPPTPAEVDAFVADRSPGAYENVVDRLLASPRFGERMVWEWLEAARYADTNGFQEDRARPMWPWRDWAVRAFNANLRFDQFTLQQIAGDLLPGATPDQILATGFHRNHMLNGEGGRIPEESRVEYVVDRVDTTGAVWLGLTVGCARCHDHKFDPLTRTDYYGLYAYFNSIDETGAVDHEGAANPVMAYTPPGAEKPLDVMVMRERKEPRETRLLIRGAYDQYGETVQIGTPAALPPLPAGAPKSRLALAQWLVSKENPLTARVSVNRLWQQFFGVGLVKTTEDFGLQGEPPSHPELLDWLAADFRDSGWDVKGLIRRLVTSAAYRQSSQATAAQFRRDPENRLLARGPRYRWPSWMLRDQALALAGLLVEKVGGPPVKPYQPEGVWEDFSYGKIVYQQDHGEALYRRSLYTFWRRSVAPTSLFDTAARRVCTLRGTRTNTPLQALTLLNDLTFVEAARAFAERAMKAGGRTPDERLAWAFRAATARAPDAAEAAALRSNFQRALAQYALDRSAAVAAVRVGESIPDPALDPVELAAYQQAMRLILNLDETLSKE